jgi:tRNA dimethylallyltransferase
MKLVVIVGPTGAGKTALAARLASRLGGEVVSADSQQVYAGMDIGTGKATAEERAAAPHHLLDVVRPDEDMTAARFAALADEALAGIAARGKVAIVCGGTGLYVRVLLYGLAVGPPADPDLRAELAAQPVEELWTRLDAVDPTCAARIERQDRKRISRALEVFLVTGEPMSVHQARHDFRAVPPRYDARLIGLAPARDALYARIDARVDQMLAAGLLDEVRGLRAQGYLPPLRSQQAIGYAELHAHEDGVHDLARATELIKRNSRRYARRQRSWYRGDPTVTWSEEPSQVDLDSLERYLAGPQAP